MSKKARVQDYSWGHSLVYPLLASIIDKLDYLKHTLRCRKLKSHPSGGKRGVGSFRGRARLLIYLLRTSGRTCHAEPPYCSPPIPDSSPSFSIPLSELLFPPFPLSFSLPLHALGTLEEYAFPILRISPTVRVIIAAEHPMDRISGTHYPVTGERMKGGGGEK